MFRRKAESVKAGKTLVFFAQEGDVRPLMRVVAAGEGQLRDVVAVAVGKPLADHIADEWGSCHCLDDYLDLPEGEEIKKMAIDWLDDWVDRSRAEGGSYKELATVDGIGLWWFILPVLIPDVQRCIQLIEGVTAMLKVERPERIVLVDVAGRLPYPMRLWLDDNLPGKIAQLVCAEHKVAVRRVHPGVLHSISWLARWAKAALAVSVYYALIRDLVVCWRIWLSRGKPSGPSANNVGTVALISSPVYWRQTIDQRGEVVVDDAVAGSSAHELAARGYRVLGIDVDLGTPNWRQFGVLREKRKQADIDWRAIEHYRPFTSIGARRLRKKKIRKIAHQGGSAAVREWGMAYKTVCLAGVLGSRFDFIYDRYIEQALGYMDALEHGLKREKVQLFLLVYEEGAPGRGATLIGQRHGVPTMALQHGGLSSPFVPAYYMKSVSTDPAGDPVACPIPNCTAVYGEHMRSMLVDISNYPSENVDVVGWPAYDGIVNMLQLTTQAEARAAMQLDATVPVVLVISQTFYTRENWVHYAEVVLGAAVDMPRVQWVIKLHPSEQVEAWQERIEAYGLEGRIALYTEDLHLLLSTCDAVVSWYSTVILEAVLCRKPVVCIKIPGCLAPVDYIRDGLVVEASSTGDLERILGGVMDSAQEWKEWTSRSVQALEKYVYRPDGMASGRVADLVTSRIATSLRDP